MLSRIPGITDRCLAFNARLSAGFSRTIGLADLPTYIDASSTYYIDAVKHALVTLRSAKEDSRPLVVLDVGCGKISSITREMKNDHPCLLYGMDLSSDEIEANDVLDEKIVYDACNPNYKKDLASYAKTFDLIVSHTFLEHVEDPETVHRLLGFSLRDNGIIVHLYPTLFDPFLTLNHLLPEWLTKKVLMILQPSRTETGKFPSYYKYCRAWSSGLQAKYKELGFRVLNYRNFYGSHYLYRFFPLQALLDGLYLLALKLDFRLLTSRSCIILSKDNGHEPLDRCAQQSV
jgi:2-polyprenyl-3-methyl-5-hydroxy-6-metoxy-1,4-benzoquinol methylase